MALACYCYRSPADSEPGSFLYISLLFSFDVQVFVCLDLNGRYCSLLSRNEKH